MNIEEYKLPAGVYERIRQVVEWSAARPPWFDIDLPKESFSAGLAGLFLTRVIHQSHLTGELGPFKKVSERILEVNIGQDHVELVMCHFQTNVPSDTVIHLKME